MAGLGNTGNRFIVELEIGGETGPATSTAPRWSHWLALPPAARLAGVTA